MKRLFTLIIILIATAAYAADVKISDLPSLGEKPASGDTMAIDDISTGVTKSVTYEDLLIERMDTDDFSAVTSLADNDLFVVADVSDSSAIDKKITKANTEIQLRSDTGDFSAVTTVADADTFPMAVAAGNDIVNDKITWAQLLVNINALDRISSDTILYCDPAGNDTTGDGSSGTPWFSPHKAIDYLKTKWIESDTTVTIQMNDGTFDLSSEGQLDIAHPCGDRIVLSGETDSDTTELQFDGNNGIYVEDGNAIGSITKLKITGDGTNHGIWSYSGGVVHVGADVQVEGFENGLRADIGSFGFADSIVVDNCDIGVYAVYGSYIRCNEADVDNCVAGMKATNSSEIDALSCNIDHDGVGGDGDYGALATVNSFIRVETSTIDASGHITTDTSPTKTTADDPTFGNDGSWIHG